MSFDVYYLILVVPALLLFGGVTKAEGTTFNKLLMGAGLINVFYVILVAISL